MAQAKGEFRADCRLDERVARDPIVHPGKRRAGHLHDFFGRCDPRADRSLYWVPTLFVGRERPRPLTPSVVTIYYAAGQRGPGFSAHGDFVNRWRAGALRRRIDDCLKPLVKCGPDGRPLE